MYIQLSGNEYFESTTNATVKEITSSGKKLRVRSRIKPFDKNYAIGVEAWKVYQRNYDQMFGILDDVDYETTTGHISFYYHEPMTNIIFKMKYEI